MLKQNFDVPTLRACLRKKDFGIHQLKFANREMLDDAIADICREANRDDYTIQTVRSCTIKGKNAYALGSLADNLVARRINKILRRVYKVKQANRSSIIKQIGALLSENTPYSVIRTDIKSFYESISPERILDKIKTDGIVSTKVYKIIKDLYVGRGAYDGKGLRRGLGLSATLSELYLRKFDRAVKTMKGVFYYARYVDDIVVFTIGDAPTTLKAIHSALYDGLELNTNKTRILYVPCKNEIDGYDDRFKCKQNSGCNQRRKEICFLGYSLNFVCYKNEKYSHKHVNIGIAPNKVKKIKTRIARSFIDYSNTSNFQLLKKRIQFVTGNYRLDSRTRAAKLMSGIFFNYPLLTKPYRDLEDLDSFLRNCIFSTMNTYKGTAVLSCSQQGQLKKFSFSQGYSNKFSKPFSATDIEEIKRCWKYE